MTSNIYFGSFKPVKPNAVSWDRSIDNFSDTAKVKIPATAFLKKEGTGYSRVQTGNQLAEGMRVEIYAGYDGDNQLRFKGFIRRINFTIPLEIECEGYAYQLRQVLDFTKSYQNTTVRKILEDATQGTDITLSSDIPEIPIEKAVFKNASGIQVLEWLKEKCLLTVYFNFEELYVGGQALEPKGSAKFRLGWNTAKDDDLKFNDDREFAEVRIEVGARNKQGERERAFTGAPDGQVKRLNTAIKDKATQAEIAEEQKRRLVNRGYEGSITAFLIPYVEPGMSAVIDDRKYPDRKGTYFITGVEGTFSKSGGRQKVKIGYSLGA